MSLLSVIILTRNEEKHLARLLESFATIDASFHVVDSYSDDGTLEIARRYNAEVLQNPFVNYASQFQWGIEHCSISSPWIMRMDADEFLTPELANEIKERLAGLTPDISGIVIKRRVYFMGKWIRRGGYYPIKLLRIWRYGMGSIEQKWMDEHIVLSSGNTLEFSHDLVDDNLNNLTWWTDKHNDYATREAIDLLNRQYRFFDETEIHSGATAKAQDGRKRWYKHNVYGRSPLFLRAFLYFLYRYLFRLGFLDGRRGLIWHFLQAFWYRFLVDAKIYQIKWWAAREKMSVRDVIEKKFNFRINF